MPVPGQAEQAPPSTAPFTPTGVAPTSGDTAPLPAAQAPQPTQAMPPGLLPTPPQPAGPASSLPASSASAPELASASVGSSSGPASPPRRAGLASRRALAGGWHLGQGLATLGAALFVFAAWATWATAIALISVKVTNGVFVPCSATETGCQQHTSVLYLNPGEMGAPPLLGAFGASGAFFWWSVLTVVGLLLCPFLWQAARPWLSRLALGLYTLWALAMTVICARAGAILTQNFGAIAAHGAAQTLYVYAIDRTVAIQSAQVGPGLSLAIVALALAFAGVALSIVTTLAGGAPVTTAPITANLSQTTDGRRAARAILPGASVVTLGLVLWVWGFFLLPWATVNCNQTPLLIGVCYGLPVSSALQIGMYSPLPTIDSYIGVYAIGALLLLGAIFIAITLWRRAINRTLCLWATLWLLVSFAFALVASHGAALAVEHPASYTLEAGVWRGDSGVLVVFLALLMILVGLVPLWAVAQRRSRRIAATDAGG